MPARLIDPLARPLAVTIGLSTGCSPAPSSCPKSPAVSPAPPRLLVSSAAPTPGPGPGPVSAPGLACTRSPRSGLVSGAACTAMVSSDMSGPVFPQHRPAARSRAPEAGPQTSRPVRLRPSLRPGLLKTGFHKIRTRAARWLGVPARPFHPAHPGAFKGSRYGPSPVQRLCYIPPFRRSGNHLGQHGVAPGCRDRTRPALTPPPRPTARPTARPTLTTTPKCWGSIVADRPQTVRKSLIAAWSV